MSKKNKIIGWIILIIHLVGALGTLLPQTRELTIQLTPLNLIISASLMVSGHTGKWRPLCYFFLISFTVGFFVEVIGVHTGFPFGNYRYGSVLGWKLLEVPVIIGINWFMLAYAFGMLYEYIPVRKNVKPILAATSMVVLDVLIEQVAITLDYWVWEGGNIPLLNYVGWFFVALVIQFCFKMLNNSKTNPLIIPLIVSQIIYFTLVFIFVKF